MGQLRWLTAGESHGMGLIGILEGLPAGLEIAAEYINAQLTRRQMGHGRGKRMQIEQDKIQIWSGVRHGRTMGSPIALLLPNRDWENWKHIMSVEPAEREVRKITLPRPGHADLAGVKKYDHDDIRNVLERSSARETAMRVALGSLARKLLEDTGIEIGSRVLSIHEVEDRSPLPETFSPVELGATADRSPVRCLDDQVAAKMVKAIDDAKAAGDSVGGTFQVFATGLPFGLGSAMQWDLKLRTLITSAIMSINAIKGVELGIGFAGGRLSGSDVHDEIITDENGALTRATNNAGGIEGGMSNGQPLVLRAVMKPIPTLRKPLRSIDIETGEPGMAHKERTDACAVPAASIVAESMIAFVLADALLMKFGGDSMTQLQAHMRESANY